jgi:hypothetical protein
MEAHVKTDQNAKASLATEYGGEDGNARNELDLNLQ